MEIEQFSWTSCALIASRLNIVSLFFPQIVCNLCFYALWEPKSNELVKSVEVFRTAEDRNVNTNSKKCTKRYLNSVLVLKFIWAWHSEDTWTGKRGIANCPLFFPIWFRSLLCSYRYINCIVSDGKVVNIEWKVFLLPYHQVISVVCLQESTENIPVDVVMLEDSIITGSTLINSE